MLVSTPIQSRRTLFTPTWTNITLGTSTTRGSYIEIGSWIEFEASIIFATGFSITGQPSMALPVTARIAPSMAAFEVDYVDSGNTIAPGGCVPTTTSTGGLTCFNTAGNYALEVNTSSSAPITFGLADAIEIRGHYLGIVP